MKKILYAALLAVSTLTATSCRDEDNLPFPKTVEYPVVFTNVSASNGFKIAEVQGTGAANARFDIQVEGDVSKVDAIEVYRTFVGYNVPATTTPPTAPVLGIGGPTVLLRTVAPASGTVEVGIDELVTGLTRPSGASQTGARVALTRASLKSNEGFRFTYALKLKDGSRVDYSPTFLNAPYSGIVAITQ
ncbi:hypothetical protein LJ737_08565 [Hymenobacter sp. 15J16-1T3B]|uniref:hypothetical protein n=1 Tax=Hymenobacter sp. 15J16-1T3B TaxID=2886941 RepID=UPI001D103126|nr:hypothetical protein [Hymenobacter sp. 15J16-1T3B]MCC3157289.1 hypothetical protein [Hymenobacter sp. 15J16-1T3B]